MSKIVVTGANGFVGKHLLREMVDNGFEVIAVSGSDHGAPDITGPQYLTLDLAQPDQAKQIDFSSVEGVIHLAALAAVAPSFEEPMRYITANIGIEVNLFEAALAQSATPRFLVISSSSLYDPSAPLPITETSPVKPSSPYAVSKLGQEQMAQYYQVRGFESISARPFNHIGPGQKLGFIVPDLANQIINAEKSGTTEIMAGNLDAKRDYTDVRDIVRGYRLLLQKGRPGEIYNLCSGKPISGHAILDGLSQAAGITLGVKQDPSRMRPSDTPILFGNHDKLAKDTGWQPEIPLETTLGDVIDDWRSR